MGNFQLQKKLITFKNKEKALDFLVSITRELEDLYIQYWGSATHNKTLSLQIIRKQTQFSIFLNFAHKKYKLDNKDTIDKELRALIKNATDGEFDSLNMMQDTEKSTKISQFINNLMLALLENKM
ncbi:hypothetical protein [bacterium endosymbiont of Bathymodiolus sp. 5 South]|uniref:hypothetical protein n=1 Tax=bacterium endosymbiont of Bathymodiolus sp. 5 South TaxID=1181670 RepID=UPI001117E9D8|nr:hypothetical protein [bacterium endosymbiont of Bathymodiolus sp. 5 South]